MLDLVQFLDEPVSHGIKTLIRKNVRFHIITVFNLSFSKITIFFGIKFEFNEQLELAELLFLRILCNTREKVELLHPHHYFQPQMFCNI